MSYVPDPTISILAHDLEISHGREKIKIPVPFVATTRVIKSIQWSVSSEKLPLQINNGQTQRFLYAGGGTAKTALKK